MRKLYCWISKKRYPAVHNYKVFNIILLTCNKGGVMFGLGKKKKKADTKSKGYSEELKSAIIEDGKLLERYGKSPKMERRRPGKKNRHVSKNTVTKSRQSGDRSEKSFGKGPVFKQ
jgi:hypothetical protein